MAQSDKPNPMGVMPNKMNNSNGMTLYGRRFTPSGPEGGLSMGNASPIPLPKGPLQNPLTQPLMMTPQQQQTLGTKAPLTLQQVMEMPVEQWDALKAKFGVFNG